MKQTVGLKVLKGEAMNAIGYILIIFFNFSAFAMDSTDECEKQYALPQPARKLGKHAMRSQQDLDDKECSSQVGPDFCKSSKKELFMKNCDENFKKEQEKRIKEAIEIQEKIKKEKLNEFSNRHQYWKVNGVT